jgi:hypothetical protein
MVEMAMSRPSSSTAIVTSVAGEKPSSSSRDSSADHFSSTITASYSVTIEVELEEDEWNRTAAVVACSTMTTPAAWDVATINNMGEDIPGDRPAGPVIATSANSTDRATTGARGVAFNQSSITVDVVVGVASHLT